MLSNRKGNWPRAMLLTAILAIAGRVAAANLALDDYDAVTTPDSVATTPDGRLIAFVADNGIEVVADDGGPRNLTSESSSAWSPVFSADGKSLYFLSDRSEQTQLYRLRLDAPGEAEELTDLDRGVDSIVLSPDESELLLTYDDQADAGAPAERDEPWVIDRLEFKADEGDGYLTERPSDHIYRYDIDAAKLTPVTRGRFAETEPAWSPDGKSVVFVSNREAEPDASYRTDLWVVPAAGAGDDDALTRLTDDDGVKDSPAWSPDGRSIAFFYQVDGVYGINELALVPAKGGPVRFLTRGLDRWVEDFRFSADGRSIYFTYDAAGDVHLARVRLSDGQIETLADGPIDITAFDVSDNGRVAAAIATGNAEADIYRIDAHKLRRLTTLNADFLARVTLGEKTSTEYASRDGTRVQTFVTRPPGFESGRRYPAILKIHGGPVEQYSWGYDFTSQYLAAQGYVVIEPNPRGSTGRGQAFVRAIYRSWGITDYDDVIGAVDQVIALGYADPDRLAVTGYSYGGYMTNVVITRTDRFKAAATGAGDSLIAANYGHDIYQKWYNWELGPPWEHPERYERLSPLLRVAKVTTPTLFLGGREDWNVPILNAELFYQSLKVRGIDTRLVVYPGTHHGEWSGKFEKDYLERVVAWFDAHLGKGAGTVRPAR
jgi:dipeptidyl aminopeptidase/acylaminoacyl peptidase